jgi:hypothetical protein
MILWNSRNKNVIYAANMLKWGLDRSKCDTNCNSFPLIYINNNNNPCLVIYIYIYIYYFYF